VAAGGVKDDCGEGGIASGDEDANVCTICLDSMQEVCIFGLQCGLVSARTNQTAQFTGMHCTVY
jgi:hypothetical protein